MPGAGRGGESHPSRFRATIPKPKGSRTLKQTGSRIEIRFLKQIVGQQKIKTMYIFLDIDGVLLKLVKADAPVPEIDLDEDFMKFDENCLTLFENVVHKYAHSQIVISSSWREIWTFETIQSLFSKKIAKKILGVTPRCSLPIKYLRHQEVLDYLKQYYCDAPWVAIDDKAAHYPPDAPVIVTNPYTGFDNKAAEKLDYFLAHGKLGTGLNRRI